MLSNMATILVYRIHIKPPLFLLSIKFPYSMLTVEVILVCQKSTYFAPLQSMNSHMIDYCLTSSKQYFSYIQENKFNDI